MTNDCFDLPGPGATGPRRLRLGTAADVLAFVPYSLGFHPQDSLVLLSVSHGGRPMTARADLVDDDQDARSVAEDLARAARVNRSREVLLVAYTDDPARALLAVDEVAELLDEHDIPVSLTIRADGGRWFPLAPGAASWSAGTAYDLETHPLTATSVLEGRVTYADRDELSASLDPAEPDLVDAVVDALADLAPLDAGERPRLRTEAEWAAGWVRVRGSRQVEVPRWPPAEDVARLLRVLEVPDARDVVWAEITQRAARGQVGLWRSLARLAPESHRAPVSALLAFAAWLDGDGALAWCAVDRARACDPDQGVATLVAQALENAVPPTTWPGLDPATLPLLSA